jgi:cytochrome c-type biogenesis protein CcmH/NrfG
MVAKKKQIKKKEVKKRKVTSGRDRTRAIAFSIVLLLAIITIASFLSLFFARVIERVEKKQTYLVDTVEQGLRNIEIKKWERVVEVSPTYFPAWVALTKLYYEEKSLSQAEEAYWKAWKLSPNSTDVKELQEMLYGTASQ